MLFEAHTVACVQVCFTQSFLLLFFNYYYLFSLCALLLWSDSPCCYYYTQSFSFVSSWISIHGESDAEEMHTTKHARGILHTSPHRQNPTFCV